MRWISVKDELPENQSLLTQCNEYVLVYIPEFGEIKAMYCDGEWYINYLAKIIRPVTHWMPIKKPSSE